MSSWLRGPGEDRVVSDPLAREDPFYSVDEYNPDEEVFNDGIREITVRPHLAKQRAFVYLPSCSRSCS